MQEANLWPFVTGGQAPYPQLLSRDRSAHLDSIIPRRRSHALPLVRALSLLHLNMSALDARTAPVVQPKKLEKKPIKFSNLLLGAGLNMFEVTTLGQPLEVIKTTMAANRTDSFAGALRRIWQRGGVLGCLSLPVSAVENSHTDTPISQTIKA